MIGIVRDTWRAVLVVVVVVLLRDLLAERPAAPAPPAVATSGWQQPAWQPPPVATSWQQPLPQEAPVHQIVVQQQADRPLRRIGAAFIDLGDAVIGAVRR